MTIPFFKLHGARNDFLLTMSEDVPVTDLQELAIAICDRYTGVGADGWMIVDRAGDADYDASVRLFNSDGSEPELSGNGTRCVAALLARDRAGQSEFNIQTPAGIKHLCLISRGERELLFEMNMGDVRVVEPKATVQDRDAVLVDAGNPQCVFPVEHFEFDWRALGAAVERDPRFPKRTNVSFIAVIDEHSIAARFWERGAGETNSSGTGSTGAAMAAVSRGLVTSPVSVMTPAGPLTVSLEDGIRLTGPAEYVAEGNFHYAARSRDE